MSAKFPLQVELDSGETFTVTADQRDLAAAEAQDGINGTMFTRVRFIGWSAARRAGRYSGTWEKWNTDDCVEAIDLDEQAEDGDRLDPGQRTQFAGD